ASQENAAAFNLGRKTVLDGVFYQRLQQHAGDHHIQRCGIEFLHNLELVTAKAHDLDVEIVVDEIDLILQRNECVTAVQQAAQDCGQLDDEFARCVRRDAHQRRNRIQRVEQKVRVDLILQRGHARLEQEPLLFLQLDLQTHAVPNLQLNHDHRDRRGDEENINPATAGVGHVSGNS